MWAGQAGGNVDDLAAQGSPRATAWWPPASVAAARSRLWAIAAHRIQAELAPKRPEVIFSPVVACCVDLRRCFVASVADAAISRVR